MDPDNDRQISEHVLRMHRYRTPGEQDGEGREVSPQKEAL
jgi:DNA replication licensing factor MCM3